MKTRSIDTFQQDHICDVCGRTLLRGENTEGFLAAGRRLDVCELCKPRALHEGWVREGTIPDYPNAGAAAPRRGGLFGRLRSRSGGNDGDRAANKRRGRQSLDDELAGDSWNPHAPMQEPDFQETEYQAPSRSRERAPERGYERVPEPPARQRPDSYPPDADVVPPRRPSRRGMPPHQQPLEAAAFEPQPQARIEPQSEPRPLQFTPADDRGAWDDQDYSNSEQAGDSEYEGGAIEAWASEPQEDGWLDQPVAGEAEIFDDAPHGAQPAGADDYEQLPDEFEDEYEDDPEFEQPQQLPGRRAREPRARMQPIEPQPPERRSLFRRQRGERRARQNEQEMDSGLRQPAEPRHVHAIPSDDLHKSAAAVSAFNDSEHCRTIAGVARSLGAPVVNVAADRAHAGSVWIVASWELCWYRYEVDISSARRSVRLDTQGYELSDLSEAQQTANAVANASGQVTLA
jgi:hypothetical protein